MSAARLALGASFGVSLLLLGTAPAAAQSDAAQSDAPPSSASPSPAPPASPASPNRPAAANLIFGEVLGNGLLYSVNYERLIERWSLGIRAGASFFTYAVSSYGASGNLTLLTFPIVASYYLGPESWRGHKVQLGLGGTVLYSDVSSDSTGVKFENERSGFGLAATAIIGYRYLPRDGGITFGIGFTPLLRTSRLLPWGGANVGYVF